MKISLVKKLQKENMTAHKFAFGPSRLGPWDVTAEYPHSEQVLLLRKTNTAAVFGRLGGRVAGKTHASKSLGVLHKQTNCLCNHVNMVWQCLCSWFVTEVEVARTWEQGKNQPVCRATSFSSLDSRHWFLSSEQTICNFVSPRSSFQWFNRLSLEWSGKYQMREKKGGKDRKR